VRGEHPALVVDVALVPSLLPAAPLVRCRTICVVVDVVRATTTLCVQFERGCQRVYVAGSIEGARTAAQTLAREAATSARPAPLLAGEVRSVAPPGFDYGNSPAEFGGLDLANRDVVFATTNGTRALHACLGSAATLAGSLRNATAVASAAVALAGQLAAPASTLSANPGAAESTLREGSAVSLESEPASEAGTRPSDVAGAMIVLVCSGRDGGPAYDDTLCAGCLVDGIQRAALNRGRPIALAEGARIAAAVWADVARRSVRAALADSQAGQAVIAAGLEQDLDWCAALDVGTLVPAITGEMVSSELLVIEPLTRGE
jgi:2-phosphosulfolactate phosphatase